MEESIKMKLNTLVCTRAEGTFMKCQASGIEKFKDFGDKIYSVNFKVPNAILLGSERDELWLKTEPIGKEVIIKKIKRKGIPPGFDLEVSEGD